MTFGSKIDFSPSKIDFNRLFGHKKLGPCKVDSKIAFMKYRKSKLQARPLKLGNQSVFFIDLTSPKSTFFDKPNHQDVRKKN